MNRRRGRLYLKFGTRAIHARLFEPLHTLEALLDQEGEAHAGGPCLTHDAQERHRRGAAAMLWGFEIDKFGVARDRFGRKGMLSGEQGPKRDKPGQEVVHNEDAVVLGDELRGHEERDVRAARVGLALGLPSWVWMDGISRMVWCPGTRQDPMDQSSMSLLYPFSPRRPRQPW